MKIEKTIYVLALIVLAVLFTCTAMETDVFLNPLSQHYYVQNTLKETGAVNMLSGIYLNYRLFDSVFEAAILFIATAGIFYMGKKDEGFR